MAGIPALAGLAMLCGSVSCARRAGPDRLTVVLPYEVTTLDPHATSTLSNLSVLLNVYETLVFSDAEMRLSPCLAERWETPDPKTWIFELRPNVRFHDGKLLDSSDVVFSLDRLLRRHDLRMSGYLVYIDSVEALDPRKVRIRTTRPLSILLNNVSYIAIVPNGSTDAGLSAGEDGTGPYRLRRSLHDEIELTRNESYWGPRPFFQNATFELGVPAGRAEELVQAGIANLAQCNSRSISPPAGSTGRFKVLRQPDVFVKHLAFDVGRDSTPGVPGSRNPFRDLRVRKAIDVAVDREELVAGLPVPAVPAPQLVPPFIFGFDPTIAAPRTDTALAARLLADAGYPDGFDVTLDVRRLFEPAARIVARQLARVKIRASVRVNSDMELATLNQKNETSFILDRFGCTTGDISDLFDNVVHSSDPAGHFGIFNTFGYSNPAIDRLIEESAANSDPVSRQSLLQKIETMAMDDLVMVPLYVDEDIFAVDSSLTWRPRNDGMVLACDIRPANPN